MENWEVHGCALASRYDWSGRARPARPRSSLGSGPAPSTPSIENVYMQSFLRVDAAERVCQGMLRRSLTGADALLASMRPQQ